LIYELKGFKKVEIKEKEKNIGLANSIINGVTEIINKFGKIIVLEDDLVTSPNFLDFMNRALDYYETFNNIKSVNGYSLYLKKLNINKNFDVYFQTRSFPWGWGTWESEWNERLFYNSELYRSVLKTEKVLRRNLGFDIPRMLKGFLEGKNNSWYVRFVIQHLIEKKLSVYPVLSKVENIGFLVSGTHCNTVNSYIHKIDKEYDRDFLFLDDVYAEFENEFLKYFKNTHKINYRLGLLKNKKGRIEVINEFLYRFKKWK